MDFISIFVVLCIFGMIACSFIPERPVKQTPEVVRGATVVKHNTVSAIGSSNTSLNASDTKQLNTSSHRFMTDHDIGFNFKRTVQQQINTDLVGSVSDKGKKLAGDYGEHLVAEELNALMRKGVIHSYLTTDMMKLGQNHFEIDFLVKTEHQGLVILEVKYWKGEVHFKSNNECYQLSSSTNKYEQRKNPCTQAARQAALFNKAMNQAGVAVKHLRPVVVMADHATNVQREGKTKAPVLMLSQLENWFASLPRTEQTLSAHQWFKVKQLILKLEGDADQGLYSHKEAA